MLCEDEMLLLSQKDIHHTGALADVLSGRLLPEHEIEDKVGLWTASKQLTECSEHGPPGVDDLKLTVAGKGLWVSRESGCVPAIVCSGTQRERCCYQTRGETCVPKVDQKTYLLQTRRAGSLGGW